MADAWTVLRDPKLGSREQSTKRSTQAAQDSKEGKGGTKEIVRLWIRLLAGRHQTRGYGK
jgi:hypothetical protein